MTPSLDAIAAASNLGEAAVMCCPGLGVPAHPPDCLDNLIVHLDQGAVEYGLMMGDPIAQASDRIHAAVNRRSLAGSLLPESLVDGVAPKGGVIPFAQQTYPKCELKLSNDPAGKNGSAVLCKFLNCIENHRF